MNTGASSKPGFNHLNLAIGALLAMVFLAQLFVVIYSPKGAGVGFLISLAGLAVGLAVGFLFAVPRVVQDANAATGAAVKSSSSLEEVSDWFVKLLLGAGLAQLSAIAGKVDGLAILVAQGFVGVEPGAELAGAKAVALALVTMHPVVGFLLGFLWTRLRLSPAFDTIEKELRTAPQLAQKVHEQASAVLNAERDKNDLSPVLGTRMQAALTQLAALPPEQLETPEEKLSWALAKATQVAAAAPDQLFAPNVLQQARRVLEGALLEDPAMAATPLADVARRQLDESELFGLLYQPGGPAKAIAAFGDPARRERLSPQSLGYLVCAYGQQHAQTKDQDEKGRLALQAWELMQQAIGKDQSLEQWFRFLLQQDSASIDNDLTSLRAVSQFTQWLGKS